MTDRPTLDEKLDNAHVNRVEFVDMITGYRKDIAQMEMFELEINRHLKLEDGSARGVLTSLDAFVRLLQSDKYESFLSRDDRQGLIIKELLQMSYQKVQYVEDQLYKQNENPEDYRKSPSLGSGGDRANDRPRVEAAFYKEIGRNFPGYDSDGILEGVSVDEVKGFTHGIMSAASRRVMKGVMYGKGVTKYACLVNALSGKGKGSALVFNTGNKKIIYLKNNDLIKSYLKKQGKGKIMGIPMSMV